MLDEEDVVALVEQLSNDGIYVPRDALASAIYKVFPDRRAIQWSLADVLLHALTQDTYLDIAEGMQVLNMLIASHDATIGIGWSTIISTMGALAVGTNEEDLDNLSDQTLCEICALLDAYGIGEPEQDTIKGILQERGCEYPALCAIYEGELRYYVGDEEWVRPI